MLQDDWTSLELQQDDIVNVIGDFDAQDTCVIGACHTFFFVFFLPRVVYS